MIIAKWLSRYIVTITSTLFLLGFICNSILNIDVFTDTYIVALELFFVVFVFSCGSYYCRYIRYTSLTLFLVDTFTRVDAFFDLLPMNALVIYGLATIMALSIAIPLILSFIHFHRIKRLRRLKNKIVQNDKTAIN